jgi:hypothetical protein
MRALLISAILALLLVAQPQSATAIGAAGDVSAQRDVVCPQVHRPVCAVTRAGRARTYSNSCHARRSGARILYRGECKRRVRPPIKPPAPFPGRPQ